MSWPGRSNLMIARWHLAALTLLVCVASTARAVDTLDLIPADALGSFACKSIEGLVKKSEKLVKDVEIKLPDSPAALCRMLFMSLGINAGLDTKGNCSAVVVNEKHVGGKLGFRNLDQYIVLSIPFSDIDAMAGNFDLGKG